MFEFFDWIVDFCENIWDFLVNIFEGMTTLLGLIPSAVTIGPTVAGYVPAIVSSCVITVISISVAKLLVGR